MTEPDPLSQTFYSSDAEFTETGNDMTIGSEFQVQGLDPVYKTVRSFPDGDRNCYTLNPLKARDNNKYLIRARFMYGNYDGKNFPPTFDIYIGVNFWWRMSMKTATNQFFIEIVHKPTTDSIDICLVNIGQGMPFISALELRPLNDTIYNCDSGSLSMIRRYNAGSFGPNDLIYASYHDDIYDRFWTSIPSDFGDWETISTSTDLKSLRNDAYEIPPSIFRRGARPKPGNRSMNFFHSPSNLEAVFYVYWHFAETQNPGDDNNREFSIYMNGDFHSGPIKLNYLEALTVAATGITLGPTDSQLWFSINHTNASTLPPFLNAFEIYTVIELPQSPTNQDDVNAIMDVKTKYKLRSGWQGDPCLPRLPWDGLNCSINGSNSPAIISLNLASRELSGEILPSFFNLTSLNYLNLSNNSLTGTIPEFLATMPSLKVIDLSGNKLSGTVPVALTDKVQRGLLSLSLGSNPDLCTSDPCRKKHKKHEILVPLAGAAAVFVLLIAVTVFFAYKWKGRKVEVPDGRRIELGMKSKNRRFTHSEVIDMTNNFRTIIGKGGYGIVYHGSLKDGTQVAVKILKQSSTLILKSFQTEAELLMRVHHRNLVSLVGYCDEGMNMALIYDYMANGDLQACLSGTQRNVLSWKERVQISVDAAQGLEYLHSGCKPAIVHRDMKTANILLDDKLQAKIADFGLSRIFVTEGASHISTDHVAGTLGYLDPEYQVSFRLNEKSDVFSFGVILLELITGRAAIIRYEDIVHIVNWVTPLLERGDIHSIVDQRLHGDFCTNSAWKALETAMACVPPRGLQRPSMGQVLVDLKECLALELAYENAINGVEREPNSSSQTFNGFSVDSEAIMGPSLR